MKLTARTHKNTLTKSSLSHLTKTKRPWKTPGFPLHSQHQERLQRQQHGAQRLWPDAAERRGLPGGAAAAALAAGLPLAAGHGRERHGAGGRTGALDISWIPSSGGFTWTDVILMLGVRF